MRFSFESRCRVVQLVLAGRSPQAAAAACGASRATGYRLWRRFQEGGFQALADRRPVPLSQPRRLPQALEARILAARAQARRDRSSWRDSSGFLPRPCGRCCAGTVSLVLPTPLRGPVRRYERERPGELVHVDIKRLGRFQTLGKRVLGPEVGNRSRRAGWQYLHLAVDDRQKSALGRGP
jgi:transposase-like protein